MAYAQLAHDSTYYAAGFTADRAFLREETFCGLPVVAFDEVERYFPPDQYHMFVSISFRAVNRLRAEKFEQARAKGYMLPRLVSPRAGTYPDLVIGENSSIGQGCLVAPFVTIGDNVSVASGCIIGHNTVIDDHCYLAPGCVISGSVHIGRYSLIGAGAVIRDRITIAPETVVGAGAVILEDTHERGVYLAASAERLPITSDRIQIG
jgi:sugar O-acyltransferase (sialic acid O-acetyltransferase NeuD family)